MTASILDNLDRLADEHPNKPLYSYLDLNGNPIETHTYASFLRRAQAIAGHLRKEGCFAAGDRVLLAYPPGLEMICAFFGCVRAGLIPVPVYPPSSRGFQSALYKMIHIAMDRHRRIRRRDCEPSGCRAFEGLVSPIHLGFDDGTQGRDRNARKHSGYL